MELTILEKINIIFEILISIVLMCIIVVLINKCLNDLRELSNNHRVGKKERYETKSVHGKSVSGEHEESKKEKLEAVSKLK